MKNYIFLHPLSEKGLKEVSIFNITFYKNMNHPYKKIIVSALLGTLFLGACSDDAPSEGEGKQQTYSLVVKVLRLPVQTLLRSYGMCQFSSSAMVTCTKRNN